MGEWTVKRGFMAEYLINGEVFGTVTMREPGCYRASAEGEQKTFEESGDAYTWVEEKS